MKDIEKLKSFIEDLNKPDPEIEASFIQTQFMYQVGQYLKQNKLPKKYLAEKMGVSRSYLSQLFGEFTNLSLLDMAKIKLALDVEVKVSIEPKKAPQKPTNSIVDSPRGFTDHKIETPSKIDENYVYAEPKDIEKETKTSRILVA